MEKTNTKTVPEMTPEVSQYLRLLIREKKLDTLPAKLQSEMLLDLYMRYMDYLLVNTATSLEGEKRDQFDKLLDTGASQDEINAFIKENVDSAKVARETNGEFREIFLGKQK